jgi:hypothetical protein
LGRPNSRERSADGSFLPCRCRVYAEFLVLRCSRFCDIAMSEVSGKAKGRFEMPGEIAAVHAMPPSPSDGANDGSLNLTEEGHDDLLGQSGRAERLRIETAPARLYFRQQFVSASKNCLVECAFSPDPLKENGCDDLVFKKRGLTIGDLVLYGDPNVRGHRFGRSEVLPMANYRGLHPLQISRVVYVTHEVDIPALDADREVIRNR